MAGKNKKEKRDLKHVLTDRHKHQQSGKPVEIGGPKGPEPTRYGDWERRGRCIDF